MATIAEAAQNSDPRSVWLGLAQAQAANAQFRREISGVDFRVVKSLFQYVETLLFLRQVQISYPTRPPAPLFSSSISIHKTTTLVESKAKSNLEPNLSSQGLI